MTDDADRRSADDRRSNWRSAMDQLHAAQRLRQRLDELLVDWHERAAEYTQARQPRQARVLEDCIDALKILIDNSGLIL